MIEPEDLDPENFKNYEYNQELGLYFFKGVQVWFSPQQLIDLAAVVVLASESMSVEDFKEIGITPDTLGELGLKLNKEIERLG